MKLFKITGNTSKLELRLEHPIHLDGQYSIGLVGFYSDNFISNVPKDYKNVYGFSSVDGKISEFYDINKGNYSLEEIKNLFIISLKEFKKKYDKFDENDFELTNKGPFILIKSPVKILLTAIICDLLGFKDGNIEPNLLIEGIKLPKIRAFDVIEIHCNLVEPSLENHDDYSHLHKESEILYSFYPNVEFGSKISVRPYEIDYIPIKNLDKIQTIFISIQDNEGNLINNEKVKNIVYLRLIKQNI